MTAISEPVLAFMKEHMTSFERLEILLLLHRSSPMPATAQTVGAATGIPKELALETLQALYAEQLIGMGPSQDEFCYTPATSRHAAIIDALALAYREQSAAILSTMSINAIERIRSGSLRAFADAFVLRKDDGNG